MDGLFGGGGWDLLTTFGVGVYSAIATPFRFWQETQGYRDILRLCNAVTADNHTIEGGVLGTVPAPVKSYASHFVQYFLDDSEFSLFTRYYLPLRKTPPLNVNKTHH